MGRALTVLHTRVPMEPRARVPAVGAAWPAAKRAVQRAFTLVELLTVITIVGIVAAMAGPGFHDFIVQQRIRAAAYELIADLNFARSEAVKRNATVTISGGCSAVHAPVAGQASSVATCSMRLSSAKSVKVTFG